MLEQRLYLIDTFAFIFLASAAQTRKTLPSMNEAFHA
jgi:hypothetical protein